MQATTDRHPLLACTLTADALQRRLAWIHRVTRESLLTHRVDGPMLALSYRIDAKADLERIVAQERLCCPFLRFELREVQDTVRLTIEAPVGQGDDARWLFDQFLPQASGSAPARGCACPPGDCG